MSLHVGVEYKKIPGRMRNIVILFFVHIKIYNIKIIGNILERVAIISVIIWDG